MSYKLDLHTHSIASPDGGLRLEDYTAALHSHRLDYIAITDHNRVDFALQAHEQLGERIIVGEEIATCEGELIGLFLSRPIAPGQTAFATVRDIKAQAGLVYVPHPFETARSGITAEALTTIAPFVDIIETHNGRAVFENKSPLAIEWAQRHTWPRAASSDAHGRTGWGRTYTEVPLKVTKQNLPDQLQNAALTKRTVGFPGILYPKLNRIKKLFNHA